MPDTQQPQLPADLFFDYISASEVDDAFRLEEAGYPPDEAASHSTLVMRQTSAPELFLGAFISSNTTGDSEYGGKLQAHEQGQKSQLSRELIAFVCSTLSRASVLTHESMSTHEPGSPMLQAVDNALSKRSVCIHSVCVSQNWRRRGIAKALIAEYLQRLRASNDALLSASSLRSSSKPLAARHDSDAKLKPSLYTSVLLIAHTELRALYESVGFEYHGVSAVVHGEKPWLDMGVELVKGLGDSGNTLPQSQPPSHSHPQPLSQMEAKLQPMTQGLSIPPDILSALLSSPAFGSASGSGSTSSPRTTKAKKQMKLLESFESLDDVVELGSDQVSGSSSGGHGRTNKFDLVCPREGCGSVVLRVGAAEVRVRRGAGEELEPPTHTPTPPLKALLQGKDAESEWWLTGPNAMVFENVGFSRVVPGGAQGTGNNKKRYLVCADCEIGPIGWSMEGGSEFWIACDRVGYRV